MTPARGASRTAVSSGGGDEWVDLTRRLVVLLAHDRGAGLACLDAADDLEARGVPAAVALRRALDGRPRQR